MNPNAKIRNANTGDALSAVRHAVSSFSLSDRGDRPEKYSRVGIVPRYIQFATPYIVPNGTQVITGSMNSRWKKRPYGCSFNMPNAVITNRNAVAPAAMRENSMIGARGSGYSIVNRIAV